MKRLHKYNIYASLLDRFQNYLSSGELYSKYYGFSESPEFTESEFEQKQFQSLIDSINRVPFESDAADQGTAFNEVVDCLINGCKSDKMEIESDKEQGLICATFKEKQFIFPISLCREFANYFKGSVQQVYTEAMLPTRYGDVKLYGYIDELMPTSVHDIKTTKSYSFGDFKDHWQRYVYPYCLNQSGNQVFEFEYNIAEIVRNSYGINWSTYTEHYTFNPVKDSQVLAYHVELFIEFLESNKSLITDTKILNNL